MDNQWFRVGAMILTPFDPPGLMRVDGVDATHVWGIFVGDHRGYKDGSTAVYLISDWAGRRPVEHNFR
jgi:hypothetical protein